MYKSLSGDLKKIYLDQSLYRIHKHVPFESDFGMDKSKDFIEDGFGLYSTKGLMNKIGPVKTEYFRISLFRAGSAKISIGLESNIATKDFIVFGFPGQVFSIEEMSSDFLAYYMLFTEAFSSRVPQISQLPINTYPFFSYGGLQIFSLPSKIACEIELLILKINEELKLKEAEYVKFIKLYIQQIILVAHRHYIKITGESIILENKFHATYIRFLKLISQHYIKNRKVHDYAKMLNISPDHLNRIVKSQSDKTAGELIGNMLFIEAKASLLHTSKTISEIAFDLAFNDPSAFVKFFKKLSGVTPLSFRSKQYHT